MKKRGGVAHGVGPEFKSKYCKKNGVNNCEVLGI
jgi:hypothetical protein